MKTLVNTKNLTPSQAKELVHLGFVLEIVKMGVLVDEYRIYAFNWGK